MIVWFSVCCVVVVFRWLAAAGGGFLRYLVIVCLCYCLFGG